jgi:hypothetical protein
MVVKTSKEIRRFDAIANNGESFTIIERRRVQMFRDIKGNLQVLDGSTFFTLPNGTPVNRSLGGTYKAIDSSKVLREVGQTDASSK